MDVNAVTYLGHAGTVIELSGLVVYTDPHFGTKAFLAKRRQPAVSPETLPPPDVLVISHAHYDHLDLGSFKYFSSEVPVLLPDGLRGFLARFIRNPLIELRPGSEFVLDGSLTIRAVPVKHRGGRLTGLRYTASTGYFFKGGGKGVFFAGDTAYDPSLGELGTREAIDCALLPIGPCYPRWFMKRIHMNPAEALRLFAELKAQILIPIHWGTFRLGLEGAETPLYWLKGELTTSPLAHRVKILQPGERRII